MRHFRQGTLELSERWPRRRKKRQNLKCLPASNLETDVESSV